MFSSFIIAMLIAGIVRDPAGQPIAGASVSIANIKTTQSAGDGTFAPATSYATGVVNGMATHVAIARLDGPIDVDYFRQGGILPAVLRRLAAES